MSKIKEIVRENYAEIARQEKSNGCCGPDCCGPTDEQLTEFSEDYTKLDGYFEDADYGLGCGLPTSFAGIKPGNTVLDLGSGAGNDVFVARAEAGEKGKVIGVDFTPEMIAKANRNKERLGFDNVWFIQGDIEKLPIQENSVDVVISNCVLNLVENKRAVFSEIHKVLKPGGHFSISDVVTLAPLSEKVQSVAKLYTGCISGAIPKDDYLDIISKAGFSNIEVRKEKNVTPPEGFLKNYLSQEEIDKLQDSKNSILSITVIGTK